MTLQNEQLLAAAERTTGLSDWGGAAYFEHSFRQLYGALANSVATEAGLTQQGAYGAELRLRAMAESRLQFINDRKIYPTIAEEVIGRPIFILGLPRAGSTFLHSLMSQDPANRNPKIWEMWFPSPPPEISTYGVDGRIERARELLRAMGLDTPDVTALHPFDAELPEECHHLMELMALGDSLPGVWRVPGFNKARAGIDLREGYLIHRMALQNLQFRYPAERWVLKNPGHVFYLEHLLAVYPDAQIIQTHRDPTKVIPSVAALLIAMRRAGSDYPSAGDKIARGNLRAFADGLRKAIEFRERPGVDERFHDVHFRSLILDPMNVVRQIYRRFNLPLSSDAESQMQQWLNGSGQQATRSRYTLQDFGLNDADIDLSFGKYMRHYDIEYER